MPASAPSTPRIGVVSGRYPPTTFESAANHRRYCDRHGYTYIHCAWPTRARNRYMNKVEYLKAYYHLFDYLFWIDDDAFFLDFAQPLEPYLPPPGAFLSICASPDFKDVHTFVSAGQFVLACSATGRAFIEAVGETDLDRVREWWRDELGYFSRGDQDAMVHLLLTDARFAAYQRLDYRCFNGRFENLQAGELPFVVHFTGRPLAKARAYRRAQRMLRRGPALLATADDDGRGADRVAAVRRFLRHAHRLLLRLVSGT